MSKKNDGISPNFKNLSADLITESDRGCVLVGAAYIEQKLEELLRLCFTQVGVEVKKAVDPMFVGMGGLTSLDAKCKLALALKLVSKEEYSDYEKIRKIRNEFAHSYEGINFSTDKIYDRTRAFNISKDEKANHDALMKAKNVSRNEKSKTRFTVAVAGLVGGLEYDIESKLKE